MLSNRCEISPRSCYELGVTEPRKLNEIVKMTVILERNSLSESDLVKQCKLSQLLQGGNDCDSREWFVEPFVSREQWAFILGINSATLYRWQAAILSDRLLSILYSSSKSHRFTAHQGALLYVFGKLKQRMTYREVIEAFRKPLDGKPLWWYLQLGVFEKWLSNK